MDLDEYLDQREGVFVTQVAHEFEQNESGNGKDFFDFRKTTSLIPLIGLMTADSAIDSHFPNSNDFRIIDYPSCLELDSR